MGEILSFIIVFGIFGALIGFENLFAGFLWVAAIVVIMTVFAKAFNIKE